MDEAKRARGRAEKLRAAAEGFKDPKAKQALITAAEQLEAIAAEREKRAAKSAKR